MDTKADADAPVQNLPPDMLARMFGRDLLALTRSGKMKWRPDFGHVTGTCDGLVCHLWEGAGVPILTCGQRAYVVRSEDLLAAIRSSVHETFQRIIDILEAL